jgi:hypothetical protein
MKAKQVEESGILLCILNYEKELFLSEAFGG